jgi:hypothetical protein
MEIQLRPEEPGSQEMVQARPLRTSNINFITVDLNTRLITTSSTTKPEANATGSMATISAPRLYRETRLNLDPAHAKSTISLTLPNSSSSRQQSTRQVLPATAAAPSLDETAFAQQHLASTASVYFRSAAAFPRCILWRVLHDARVLELAAVDLTQDLRNRDEAQLTLQIRFPAAIRPFGVAFAEPADRDALCVFVVAGNGREVYTLTLGRSAWVKENALDGDEWWRVFRPNTLLTRTVYRIAAVDARTLVASVDNGGLVRLERKAGESGKFVELEKVETIADCVQELIGLRPSSWKADGARYEELSPGKDIPFASETMILHLRRPLRSK